VVVGRAVERLADRTFARGNLHRRRPMVRDDLVLHLHRLDDDEDVSADGVAADPLR
jgi:hypothetical protein